MLTRYSHLMAMLARAALWLSGTGLVVMTVTIAWQVFGRFVLNDTPSWAEPLSLLLMLYFIFLTAAVGVREHFHLGLDLVRDLAPLKVRQQMDNLSYIIVGGFGASMAWWGGQLAAKTWASTMPVLGLPEGASYLPIALSGIMIVLFSTERLLLPRLEISHVPEHTAE